MIPSPLAKYVADLATLPGDAAIGYRNEGVHGAWEAVACRTVHRVIRASRLRVFAQTLEHIPDLTPPAGVRIARLRSDGCIGIAAWRGVRPVGYAWVALEIGPDVTRCPLELPAHAAYLWDLYVTPAERGGGLGSALAAERLRIARELGRSEAWRMITPDNTPSIRTLRRSGASPRLVGEIRYVKLGPRLFARFTPCQPPTH